ncbi:type II toxin-antitoxin system HicA family toxin [Bradyrhizobium sp. UFLA 03-164]|uniref:Type II toxin-antitoxin system HicA family toxin n=1 Tax=Bradyrhizobium uaiense TaxID=2594946 RepID=A0A6P1B8K2_9BRAD|nr:type II toxin-antitoxin system HicA family toxin [Bradyrhizobium uaiense]
MSGRLDEMARNPAAGWRIGQIGLVCEEYGAKLSPPRGGGSHFKVSKPGKKEILTIPFRRPIKPIYIKKLVAFLRD